MDCGSSSISSVRYVFINIFIVLVLEMVVLQWFPKSVPTHHLPRKVLHHPSHHSLLNHHCQPKDEREEECVIILEYIVFTIRISFHLCYIAC